MTIKKIEILLDNHWIEETDLHAIEKTNQLFSFAITDTIAKQIKHKTDSVAKQFIPNQEELKILDGELKDPIGDDRHSPIKGIVHRYPDRCLLMPIKVCPIYCRFCFRKEKLAKGDETLKPDELAKAFEYIESHPELWEVIITGGDPLILKPMLLKKIIERLTLIKHLQVIRIHTRVPVVDPDRINQILIDSLKTNKAIYIVLHSNHPQEFSEAAINAIEKIINAGIPMLSQSTLLKGVNDNIESLSKLMKCFVAHRIKPYYLHHADLVPGTSHFRTSILQGQQLVKALRGRLSGLCQPTYVLDIPGGYGKVPIGYTYLQQKETAYIVEDYLGEDHFYNDSSK